MEGELMTEVVKNILTCVGTERIPKCSDTILEGDNSWGEMCVVVIALRADAGISASGDRRGGWFLEAELRKNGVDPR
jgi:hypothetical protein